jgi:carbonic anhydrase/acetyltransferase-like protein (isoleucine patch superfamily)
VSIGNSTNLQDNVHVGSLAPGAGATTMGSYVSVGHGAVLQGCTVHDRALVGMNAVVQPGAVVKSGAIVAAGAVVPAGATVASGELWAGNPARRLRGLKPEEEKYLDELPTRYRELAGKHAAVLAHVRAGMDAKAAGGGASA